jgi:transcriptional regulator with XRE-family HTH domain
VQNEPDDLRILVGFLRLLRHQTQEEMANAAGMHPGTILRYEGGTRIPDRLTIEKLARGAGMQMWAIDAVILPAIGLARAVATGRPKRNSGTLEDMIEAALAEGPGKAASAAVAEFLVEGEAETLTGGHEIANPVADGAEDASYSDPWALAQAAEGDSLAEGSDLLLEFERLVERLCGASERAAADSPARALRLALSTLAIAKLAPGPARLRWRMEGFAWAFVANAQRVGSDLTAAAASMRTAWRLWRAGGEASESRLGEWRLLDLEASLRRDQRRFDLALDLLDRALAAAPREATGRILLKKSYTLEQGGQIEAALAALEAAVPVVGLEGEPHRFWTVRMNRLVLLCHLGRYREAEAGLPELHEEARRLGNDLDQLRARWLTGRVQAGLGRQEEARSALEAVRREFEKRLLGYDSALVCLELAILHLEAGRTGEVRKLAQQMVWLFGAQGVEREALAALRLFREAVESETITAELARGVFDALRSSGSQRPVRVTSA